MRNLPVCVNCNICSTCVFISMLCVTMSISRGHRRHMQQSQPHTTQQQVDMDFVEFPPVQAQSHAAKRYLAGEGPQVKCVQRTGPVLFCAVCDSVAANHSLDNRWHGLKTKWWTAQSSLIQNGKTYWCVSKATNRLEYTPPCINQRGICTSTYKSM